MIVANFTKPLTISLTEEIYNKIEMESDKQRISKAEYVRRLLENGFMNKEVNEK